MKKIVLLTECYNLLSKCDILLDWSDNLLVKNNFCYLLKSTVIFNNFKVVL